MVACSWRKRSSSPGVTKTLVWMHAHPIPAVEMAGFKGLSGLCYRGCEFGLPCQWREMQLLGGPTVHRVQWSRPDFLRSSPLWPQLQPQLPPWPQLQRPHSAVPTATSLSQMLRRVQAAVTLFTCPGSCHTDHTSRQLPP
eukprot:366464-Chlamydomonas_euryale.AAC.11